MLLKLPKLSYSYQDIEPYIDKDTMKIHYNKHHLTYINNLNKAISEDYNMNNLSLERIIEKVDIKYPFIRNNAGGVYNHNIFWEILIPPSKFKNPSKKMDKIFSDNFGSFNSFKKKFSECSIKLFGSGWIWLCIDDKKNLFICSTPNQDNPMMRKINYKGIPILGLDVWEHAYYLKYQNRRKDYVSSFWNIINWEKVEDNYENYIKHCVIAN